MKNNIFNFALVGLAGYVAPRHLKAIKETGHILQSAYDKCDSVGVIDSFFPDASFFSEQELFDRHNNKLKQTDQEINFLTVCTPNYLHDAHCRYGLRLGADVICEKPLCLNPWNIDALERVEQETGHRIFNILQSRYHPSIIALKNIVDSRSDESFELDLTYIASRGKWYYAAWKGDINKSGGIVSNIGVHFYDALLWIFGPIEDHEVHIFTHDRAAGFLQFKRAKVRYFLSINADLLPKEAILAGKRTYRTFTLNDENFEFSDGFTDLHTLSYEKIFAGEGIGIEEVKPVIKLLHEIRTAEPIGITSRSHPLACKPITPHPFGWLRR